MKPTKDMQQGGRANVTIWEYVDYDPLYNHAYELMCKLSSEVSFSEVMPLMNVILTEIAKQVYDRIVAGQVAA